MSGRTVLWGILVSLSLVTAAAAQPPAVIDDFESYWGQPAIETAWVNNYQHTAATPMLLNSGVAQGSQAMRGEFDIGGGWANPTTPYDDPGGSDLYDHVDLTHSFDPIDFEPGGEIHFHIRLEYGWDISKVDYLSIEWSGDSFAQTWLAGPATADWLPWAGVLETVPACIAPDNWWPPLWPPPGIPVVSPDDGWYEIVVEANDIVPWSSVATLDEFDAMNSISLQLWSSWTDTSGASGSYKLDSTGGTHWPGGPLYGEISFDYIYYVPEPATIALLGLGGLALLRRKRQKTK